MTNKNYKGLVYMMCDASNNLFKIGVTRGTTDKRIKQLQTGNGSEIHLVNYFKSEFPFKVEKMLHTHFYDNNTLNEWFELNSDEICQFIPLCEQYESILKNLVDSGNPFI